jgi:hypothetical protein
MRTKTYAECLKDGGYQPENHTREIFKFNLKKQSLRLTWRAWLIIVGTLCYIIQSFI